MATESSKRLTREIVKKAEAALASLSDCYEAAYNDLVNLKSDHKNTDIEDISHAMERIEDVLGRLDPGQPVRILGK